MTSLSTGPVPSLSLATTVSSAGRDTHDCTIDNSDSRLVIERERCSKNTTASFSVVRRKRQHALI